MGRGESKSSRPTISLFSGIGGFDLGLEMAGFDIRLCVELDAKCRKSLLAQGRKISTPGEIRKLEPAEALRQAGIAKGELFLLAGGPPCQSFSTAGQWKRARPLMKNDSGKLVKVYADYVKDTLPEYCALENVPGFTAKGGGWDYLQSTFDDINYQCGTRYQLHLWKVNAADYGVPQQRRRVFVVANRNGRDLPLPAKTHGTGPGDKPTLTSWDAIWDLEDKVAPETALSGKWAGLLKSIPEGQNYLYHTDKGDGIPLFGYRTRFWSFLLKLSRSAPSWTLSASPGPATGPFHWNNRRLSREEMLRLQTLPDDLPLSADFRTAIRQVGNAVPAALGELIGLQIRGAQLALRSIPSKASEPPPGRPIEPVPESYLDLQGEHPAHPGEGKGPGALPRDIFDPDLAVDVRG